MTEVSIKGFPGRHPEYREVPASLLSHFPYRYVGPVIGSSANGAKRSAGTGWLWDRGLVVTAAHVVEGFQHVTCRLNDGTEAVFADNADIHPGFIDAHGERRIGSPQDIAVLRIDDARLQTGLPIGSVSTSSTILMVGYPGLTEPLVEHSGNVWHAGAYLGHDAHTKKGHSGGPVLMGQRVVGLHVGVIRVVRKWQPNQPIKERDGANAALVFSDVLRAFLEGRASA